MSLQNLFRQNSSGSTANSSEPGSQPHYQRRDVLRYGLAALGSLGLLPYSRYLQAEQAPQIAAPNILLGGGRFVTPESGQIKHVLSIVELESQQHSLVETAFLPHGIHRHPQQPHRLALFEKKGPHACEVDLAEKRIVRTIPTDPKRYFYGHGSYSADGKLLYCTESYLDGFDGIIAIRDSETLAYLGEFPTYGKEPHECKLIANGSVMVVTNGGGNGDASGIEAQPSVTYIDINSQKLLKREVLSNTQLNTGHMALGEDGSLVVVSAPRAGLGGEFNGGISIQPGQTELLTLAEPADIVAQMKGEALSVVIHNQLGIAAVTHPDGNMVTFWSIPRRQLLKTLRLPHPRGVSLTTDKQSFLISYDQNPKLMQLTADTLDEKNAIIIPNTFISGSHIYNWSNDFSELFYPGPLV